ncbi:MAG: hypothetical protein GTO04_18720 [Planctomycetales bacterium]|nr:hypothetical protein [Planctomycetales bacterium]
MLSDDPRRFLRWDVVTETMFVIYAPYISTELKYLRRLPQWETCWQSAITESRVGSPIPYIFYSTSSANLIHHAYHVAQFEEKTKAPVREMDFVFEFGGGYGSMCRLFHNLGFRGTYVIFDYPAVSALQKYYLHALELPVAQCWDDAESNGGIACVSDLCEVESRLVKRSAGNATAGSLFLATWSLSESPFDVRRRITSLMPAFRFASIAYQDAFGEVDNVLFFKEWISDCANLSWSNQPLNHMGNKNHQLIGQPREAR